MRIRNLAVAAVAAVALLGVSVPAMADAPTGTRYATRSHSITGAKYVGVSALNTSPLYAAWYNLKITDTKSGDGNCAWAVVTVYNTSNWAGRKVDTLRACGLNKTDSLDFIGGIGLNRVEITLCRSNTSDGGTSGCVEDAWSA